MDPMMLLGQLSTESYARSVYSNIEKDFRAPAIPSNPKYGLRANLVESALYTSPNNLSIDDNALLLSVMAGRPGHAGPNGSADGGRRGSQKLGSLPIPPKPITTNPFLRAMSYDEYQGSSSVTRHMPSTKEDEEKAAKLASDMRNDPKVRERRRRAMLHSFEAARRRPTHPDKRKAHLKPVHIAPVLPDFGVLGEQFIVVEVDKDEMLTHPKRVQEYADVADESERTLTAVPVGKKDPSGKKFIACYTPNERTLARRKRLREEEDGPMNTDRDPKKIHFAEEETYDWIAEYTIRETKIGDGGANGGAPARSTFAAAEYVGKDPNARVVLFSRIGASWKLSKRPGTLEKLGKPGLKLTRDMYSQGDDDLRRDLIAGVARDGASKTRR